MSNKACRCPSCGTVFTPDDHGEADVEGILDVEKMAIIRQEELKIGDKIGEGAFSDVYKGVYYGTTVAVKKMDVDLLDNKFTEKFVLRELAMLKGMRHANIVQFIGFYKTDTDLFLVTEFVTNKNLHCWLKEKSYNVSWPLRIRFASDTAWALNYLHYRGILHRDVKSKNMLVDADFRIKVCDFGSSRSSTATESTTERMTIIGTDGWMAPELRLSHPDYNKSADVFGYGMILIQLITRKGPRHVRKGWTRDEPYGIDYNQLTKLTPNDCPPLFLQLAVECTAFNPARRPPLSAIIERLRFIKMELNMKDDDKLQPTKAH